MSKLPPYKPHKYTKHPEFTGLERFVWEGLNEIGMSISKIENYEKRKILDNPKHKELKDNPIWHTKPWLDEFVAMKLNLKLEDYGSDKEKNELYKAIANVVGELRRKDVLIDWRVIKKSNTGMGIWRLDKTKLDKFVYSKVSQEIKEKNFHSKGEMSMVYVRQKQNAFREELFKEYSKCAFCGFKIPEYMIGAHIVPYSTMRIEEAENAMNPSNGLLLCRFCDVAFEKGSIMLESDLGITVSEYLRDQRERIVKSWLEHIPEELKIKETARYPPEPKYLKWKKRLLEVRN